MTELADDFRALQRDSARRRAANRHDSPQRLADAGIAFESRNLGQHLIVRDAAGTVYDFWPGTGRWHRHYAKGERGPIIEGRGVFNLIKRIKGTAP